MIDARRLHTMNSHSGDVETWLLAPGPPREQVAHSGGVRVLERGRRVRRRPARRSFKSIGTPAAGIGNAR